MTKILGIDTSCYTTSLAIVDSNNHLMTEHRQVLQVPLGEKGLQQSMAVFQHIQNLPVLLAKVSQLVDLREVSAITASTRPRPVEKSYMPVFVAGASFGQALATALKVPFIPTSHQEGHLMAGLWSAGIGLPERFLAVHLSGGTSELLLVNKINKEGIFFNTQILGATTDLHAGQLVDRIGVTLGMPFPAGPYLEKLAAEAEGTLVIPSAVKDYNFSFSGAETQARKMLKAGHPASEVARAIEKCIAKTVEKVVRKAIENYNCHHVLVVGGVACNNFLRHKLKERLEHRAVGAKLYFAEGKYSSDNAVGVALIGNVMAESGS